MLTSDNAKYFVGATLSLRDGSYRVVAAKSTETHLSAVMSYVAATGLVFAHSFVEFVLETLLRMTRLCDIASWLLFIGTKNVPLSTVFEDRVESAVEAKLNDFITALHKEGLLIKIDYLGKSLKG